MQDQRPMRVENTFRISRSAGGKTHGGRIVQPIGADAPELTARFADPDGNVLGLYQEPNQSG